VPQTSSVSASERSEKLVVVQAHHHVLPAWAQYRASLPGAPRLITLDHHTDTSRPFRNLLQAEHAAEKHEQLRTQWLTAIDFQKPETVTEAVRLLGNDEHIVTAIKADIISSAFVVAHNARDTDLPTYREHKIMCRTVNMNLNSYDVSRADCDKVIDSRFLDEVCKGFTHALSEIHEAPLPGGPYILDIDLDYFNTFASVAPKDASVLRELARGAGLVTIATEPAHVQACRLDEALTDEFLLARLLTLLGLS